MAAKSRSEARTAPAGDHRAALVERFQATRAASSALCATLAPEDYVVQSMADVSPAKWHLAHTTWFFEQFVLTRFLPAYRVYHACFAYLFNSYYEGVGVRHPRPKRGVLSRPTVEETYSYRAHIDGAMLDFIVGALDEGFGAAAALIELGLNHEEQHQELILTDIKHMFGCNPLRPIFAKKEQPEKGATKPPTMIGQPGGIVGLGHSGEGFAFDNETPCHRVLLGAYRLADRPVTNGEYLEFIAADGYKRPELWLSDGWDTVRARGWTAPLYWEEHSAGWAEFTLGGLLPLESDAPVCHVSYYEADAFARFRAKRLPTEAEWEAATALQPVTGNFVESRAFHPRPATNGAGLRQAYGDVWEWMASAYLAYPGFKPWDGAVGEYNGKFMSNQFVLRGGSCATPARHMRPTYRNFFPPDARWQFSGIRLAEDA